MIFNNKGSQKKKKLTDLTFLMIMLTIRFVLMIIK